MMERRRALTIPFNVDKNNLVSWTTFAGCKRRHRDSQHKNGSMPFDHKHAALEMARRKPCLILTNVLETDLGKAYMERIRMSQGRASSTQRESGRCREEPLICRDIKSSQREARNDKNKSRKSQNVDDEEDIEENKDIKEVTIGKDNGNHFKFAEVVDCGLSVSWEPAEDRRRCDEFSPTSIKDRWTDPEEVVQSSVKRKRKDAASQCNGIGSPEHHRESVLRLTGEDRRDGGPAPTRTCAEESGEQGDLESPDRTIVQLTVGADDQEEVLFPIISPNLVAGDVIGTPRQSLSFSQDNTTTTSPSEPIVLSSDDEESGNVSQRCSAVAETLVTVEDTVIQGQSSQNALAKRQEASDMQDMQVLHVVVDVPGSVVVSPIPSISYSFSTLHCGDYKGKANGDIMIADQEIIIPLTDAEKQVDVMLIIERKDLRRYSVWEQQELEDRKFHLRGDGDPFPAAVLLFCVSETAAAALLGDLLKLCVKQDGTMNIGKVSPFILLTLTNPVEGMEGALMRSLLDIDCLNSLAHEESIHGAGKVSYLEGFYTPVLSLDDSIELMRRTGLDNHLLSLLGLESTDPRLDTHQDGPYSDTDENTTPHIQLEEPKDPTLRLCVNQIPDGLNLNIMAWLAGKLIQFPPPPLKGGITVTMEDLQCLDSGHFLNDVIIDFYLKYLLQNASANVAERTHVFSSFFYKQLTRRDNASEGVTSDLAHWYLVVICFPGLEKPKSEAWSGVNSQTEKSHGGSGELQEQEVAQGSKSPNDTTETPSTPPTLNHSESVDTETEKPQEESTKDPTPGPVNCTERTFQKETVSKRPCILIMDSLKLSLHERVFKLLREYLQSEWEVRRGSSKDFSPDQMQSSHCQVPLQDNSSDCGLYLLQYVESFLKDPVVHFDLPLQLQRWFPRQQVRRKRDEIRDLVLNLYRHQNLDSNR
ncbi:hypothetical protein FQN60_001146 [Etheostoma spectabile]|uniref:Ubiquitin-like protease family profile domain-containing protein n=1 Tax=Etheostoma spectabile TaxID=54343 RepID=A0A5J5CZY4_9PERO|nr:hypothetical protein FQN60_001146 [Etheostoma spectabile]